MRLILIAILICLPCLLARAESPKPATKPATTQATTQAAAPAKPENSINAITQKDIDAITYEDAEEDTGFITPLAADLDSLDNDSKKRLDDWTAKLNDWSGAKEENVPQRVRNLMSVACLADMIHSEFEGETAYVIFDKLKSEVDKDQLIKACAWMVLKPTEGRCITRIPELGWDEEVEEDGIRERSSMYAKKLLGRLVGKLPKKD
ncbi:MAG: type transporter [Phycisphaerales bacterium]|nr:type transporter [Phycisphaerales bacterium]